MECANVQDREVTPRRRSPAAVKLRKWRLAAGLSQAAVGELLECAQKRVSQYETGVSTPPIGQALRLSKISKGAVPIKDWDS
jgi:transcriptional regulator with XRE-family HTH domain